jgi:threonyl-tRNA synthetase
MIKIKIEGMGIMEFPEKSRAIDVLKKISPEKEDSVIACEINGSAKDLSAEIPENASLKFLTFDDEAGMVIFRHSTAHLLAHAVVTLFPDARPTIGPVVEEGFYYDFSFRPFTAPELDDIEKKMCEIRDRSLPVERIEISMEQARKMFAGNKFKLEMIEEMGETGITAYRQGDFMDLCRGPHVPNTKSLKSFKLFKLAGAYWRGDSKREQLQRIYGISFTDDEKLSEYFKRMEEAKNRDHRRIGTEMELFSFHEEGQGFPFWHPKGTVLFNTVVEYWREAHRKAGYVEIRTPQILNRNLWERSGHYGHYLKNMYFTMIDETEHAVKPMNCPGGLLVYRNRIHSYREFPLKMAELGLVHRHELSGVLHGLFRVRAFTQDDAHIFCMPSQLKDEIIGVMNLLFEIYSTFGFKDVHIELSTRPESSIGSDEQWHASEESLGNALKEKDVAYKLNPGDGAFYGPKIDFHIKDCMGRLWQCGTIQVDFSMPERFDAVYEGHDGARHTPVMVHRAILGSIERFIGIITEHYAGKFPLWLNPSQIKILPISENQHEYSEKIMQKMKDQNLRVYADYRNETLNRKVREAQLERYNYQCIVGAREVEAGTVSVRTRKNENLGSMPVEDFINKCLDEIAARTE